MLFKDFRRRISRVASIFAVRDHDARPDKRPFVVYSCHDADRSMVTDGKRYSPLLQGVRAFYDELGYGALNLSHPFAVADGKAVLDGSLTVNRRFLALRLKGVVQRLTGAGMGRLEAETKLFQDVLQRLQPAFIVAIQPPLGMCKAARDLGIGIIEAMHGTSYSLADKLFQAHMSLPEEQLPHAMLCFDETSLATIQARIGDRGISAHLSDDPWKHMTRLSASRVAATLPDQPAWKKTILITLQWGYDGERDTLSNIIPNGILHPALEAAMTSGDLRDVRFLIRMHPIQVIKLGYGHHRKYIAGLAQDNPGIEWERATSDPLPIILDQVDGHITMSSSTVGEASEDGIPSLTLCPTLHEGGAHYGFFREIEEKGLLTFGLPDTDTIIGWIQDCRRLERSSDADLTERHETLIAQYRQIASDLTTRVVVQSPGEAT